MTYTVTPNDSISSIAQKFQIPASELMSLNGLGPNSILFPGMVIIIPNMNPRPPYYRFYTVRRGDNIWSISQKFGVSVNEIMYINHLTFPFVFPGQRLKIPNRFQPFSYPY